MLLHLVMLQREQNIRLSSICFITRVYPPQSLTPLFLSRVDYPATYAERSTF